MRMVSIFNWGPLGTGVQAIQLINVFLSLLSGEDMEVETDQEGSEIAE